MASGHLALTVKATRLCNLRCTYCTDWRAGAGHTMSFEVLAHLVHRSLTDPEHRAVDFGWHGGDPLVLPIEFYETALDLQARYRRPGQLVRNNLQTNATLLTDEWAQFLRRNRFGVGVSIDGPPEQHDAVRIDRHGHGTFDRAMAGMEVLRRNDVPFGVLMTVDRTTYERGPQRLLAFLHEIGLTSVGLNSVRPPNDAAPDDVEAATYITRAEMNRFLVELDGCIRRDGRPFEVRELEAVRTQLRAQGTASCTLEGDCVGSFFLVEPDGEVAHCARFVGDERYVFGNIVDHDFAQIRRSLRLRERAAADRVAAEHRQRCTHFAVCNGGCPHQRLIEERHDPGFRVDCCGRGELIEHLAADGEAPTPADRGTPVHLGRDAAAAAPVG